MKKLISIMFLSISTLVSSSLWADDADQLYFKFPIASFDGSYTSMENHPSYYSASCDGKSITTHESVAYGTAKYVRNFDLVTGVLTIDMQSYSSSHRVIQPSELGDHIYELEILRSVVASSGHGQSNAEVVKEYIEHVINLLKDAKSQKAD
ncbi:MAG: hypothetical protein NTX25_02870 [Proteobacteria bacterium]|nr:hypothetical protein [Pseudomonadota bacterium]